MDLLKALSPTNLKFNRTIWLKIHLYLALSVGFLFALLGLTGSLCVYQEQIDQFLNPELTIEPIDAPYQSLDKILASIQMAHPQRSGSWTLELPTTQQGVITAWFDKPQETFFENYAPLMVAINPYTAEIIKSRLWGRTFSTWILNLHSQLLLDDLGTSIVGVLGILLSFSIGTGLYLWWPGFQGIWQALKVNPNAGIMRLAFDLHRWLGLVSALVLIILCITGILLSYPKLSASLFGAAGMEHGQTGKTIISTAEPNNHPTSITGAVFIAKAPFPKATLRRVTTPVGETGVYRINLKQSSEINQRHPYTTVWIDRWSGQTKEVRNPAKFSFAQTLNTWIWPVHTGEAFGASGRFWWFITGQALFWLYFSGLTLWLFRTNRLKDQKIDYALFAIKMRHLLMMLKRWLQTAAVNKIPMLLKQLNRYQPLIQQYSIHFWRQLRKIFSSLKP